MQIGVLLWQLWLNHEQGQSVSANVSLLCVGWQAVLNFVLFLILIKLCSVMKPRVMALVVAFGSVAFFKLFISIIIEYKYMEYILQARNNANNTAQADLTRQYSLLDLRFYGALMFSTFMYPYFRNWNWQSESVLLLLYSFWVPQIILNIVTESRKSLDPYFIFAMNLTHLVAPIYVFAVKNNFLKQVFQTDPRLCRILILWIGIQTAVLFAQRKYGTRFMIPQRCDLINFHCCSTFIFTSGYLALDLLSLCLHQPKISAAKV